MSQTPGQTEGQGFFGMPPQSSFGGGGGFPPQSGGVNPNWLSRYGGGYGAGYAPSSGNPYQALGPSPYSWLGAAGGGPYGGYGPGEGYGQPPPPNVRNLVGQAGNLQGLIGQVMGSQPSAPGNQPNITDIVRQVGAMNTQRDQALGGMGNQGPGQGPLQQQYAGGGWGGWGAPQGWGGGGGQRSKG